MSEHRDRYQMKYKNTQLEQYNIDNPTLVFDPRLKNFSKEVKIVSYDTPPRMPWGLVITRSSLRRGGGGRSISSG